MTFFTYHNKFLNNRINDNLNNDYFDKIVEFSIFIIHQADTKAMEIFPSKNERLNPFPFYTRMRRLNPIAFDDKNQIWGIFNYTYSKEILSNHKIFSSDIHKLLFLQNQVKKNTHEQINHDIKKNVANDTKNIRSSILTLDPPRHRQLRNVILSAFTPNRIYNLNSRIEEVSKKLLNNAIKKGEIDIIGDLAYPLPVTIIAELIGVPYRDHNLFKEWADRLLGANANTTNFLDRKLEPGFKKIQEEMDDYFNKIIQIREKEPKNDLISNLIVSTIDNNRLTTEEILSFCSLLLLAGHVTTVNLIGNTIRSLLENPLQLRKLKKNPNALIPSTIEESLRYRSPVQALFRFLLEDWDFNNYKMSRGQRIVIWLGSANHDEAIFKNPEEFDILRQPNEHIAFGYGIHFCIGSTLARLEGQSVLKQILEQLEDISFMDNYTEGSLKPMHDVFLMGVSNLPIKFKERKK